MGARISDLDYIVEHGLCAGCGLCESMAGSTRVDMALTDEGRLRPRTKQPLDTATMNDILQVCPGVSLNGPEHDQAGTGGHMNPIWGPIASLHRGWAGDEATRFHAAAGGSLTALGTYLLDSGRVEAIVHVRASTDNPMMSDAVVSTTAREVYDGAQSRYGPAAPLIHVHRLLDEGRTFSVIAKPCDVAAIRNLARIDARVEKQIPYCLTIFCGGLPGLQLPTQMAAHFGVDTDELTLFRWRGEGWPGTTHMETRDGQAFDLTYDQAYFEDDVSWKYDMQFRCKICPDAIGELADIACPDGWVMENGKALHREAPGANVLIARTAKGASLLRDAQAAGVMVLEPFSEAELDEMHVDHKPRKTGWPSRILGLYLSGKPVPCITRYRALSAVMAAGLVRSWAMVRGTMARARRGTNRETPIRMG